MAERKTLDWRIDCLWFHRFVSLAYILCHVVLQQEQDMELKAFSFEFSDFMFTCMFIFLKFLMDVRNNT